jgi:signal transduction histidine kinase
VSSRPSIADSGPTREGYRPYVDGIPRDRTRHLLVDTGIAAAAALGMVVEALVSDRPHTDLSAPSLLVIVVAVLPLLGRRRHPAWAMTASLAALFGVFEVLDIYQTAPFATMICGFTLATQVGRRTAILAGLAVAPVVLFMLGVFSSHAWLTFETFKNLAFVALPVALGIAVRDRRAYLEALVERAEAAERGREEEARRRVGEERLRIARDVHDVVAHAIVSINVQAGVAAHLLDRDPQRARQSLVDIKRVSGEALGDLRTTLGILRDQDGAPAPVRPTGELADLEDLRAGLTAASVVLDLDVQVPAGALPVPVEAAGYRIVQEALTNVLRHTRASTVRVGVRRIGAQVVVEVVDDGPPVSTVPSAPAPAGTGNGLDGMRERARAVGGSLEAGPTSTGGWRVRAVLPAPSDPSAPTDPTDPTDPTASTDAPAPSAAGR